MKAEYNSKLDKNIEVFIQKRIEGKSFDEIANDLKVAKQTLIEWNKQKLIRDTISEGKAFKINSLVKVYKYDLTNRLETYLKLSTKINNELLERDLSELNTDVLLKMSVMNDNRINEIIKSKKNIIGVQGMELIEYSTNPNTYFDLPPDE